MSFAFKKLSISDVIIIEPTIFPDERGAFFELFKQSIFEQNEINVKFVQDNISVSNLNVLRGLHFQKTPKSQAKLITVLQGEIFDVAVDIRKNSPTYGKWVGEILSDINHKLLFIPEGFAHGFCTLRKNTIVMYKVSNEYSSELERSIVWNDPEINISWPIKNPILSEKDSQSSTLKNADNNFEF